MYFEERKNKNGSTFFLMFDRYVDPLTGKRKKVALRFQKNTPRERRKAERDLQDKIDNLIAEQQGRIHGNTLKTFGKLRDTWLEAWKTSVKPMTVEREKLVLNRLSEMIGDDYLLSSMTPLLVQNILNEYKATYNATHSTMQHIKCTINKIFDYGVLHGAIPTSPSRGIRLIATAQEKRDKRARREAKFLDEREVQVLLKELRHRRNPAYLDLTIFLLATGCRIGEASALTEADIDFENKLVNINKSLQSHDLKVAEFYEDTTKTEAGERIEELPDFAIEALRRCVQRNADFAKRRQDFPSDAFHDSKVLFQTEYGSPITSHSYRELLGRINRDLTENCFERYGFEWKKNVIPHSFRHIHISVFRDDPNVPLKEVQKRVGHVQAETTNGYTHLTHTNQEKSVEAISRFMDRVE